MLISDNTEAKSSSEAQKSADKNAVPISPTTPTPGEKNDGPTPTPTPMDITPKKHNNKKADNDGKDKEIDTGNKVSDVTWQEMVEHLSEIDKESINEGKYMTCAIIRIAMNHSQKWLRNNGKKVTCLEPVIVQMIRKEDASEEGMDNMISVEKLIRDLDLENSEYILFPVNDNENINNDDGNHWSLLVYGKNTNKFYHYDSAGRSNEEHARKVVTSLAKANKGFKEEMETKSATQQGDGHSCGVCTIMNASKIAVNIVKNSKSEEIYDIDKGSKEDIVKTRNWIKRIITNKDQAKEPEMLFYMEKNKECWFNTNGYCKYEDTCKNVHKARCTEKVLTGQCSNKKCTLGHPIICWSVERGTICKRKYEGKCLYLHPMNYYRQETGHQNNRNGNNRSVGNNEINNMYPYNNITGNSDGYYNGYGGYEEWNRGNNNRTNYNNNCNNWNNTGYNTGCMGHDERNRWGFGNGREENFHTERNFREEWPTPLEGRLLRMMDMMEQRIGNRWR